MWRGFILEQTMTHLISKKIMPAASRENGAFKTLFWPQMWKISTKMDAVEYQNMRFSDKLPISCQLLSMASFFNSGHEKTKLL
jgi:hypothetical protein